MQTDRVPRLTWNALCPHPYESGWSVFAKILSVNYMRPHELVEIIKKRDVDEGHLLSHLDSSWIDFERFGAALGVEPYRLRQCFLDELGFRIAPSTYPGVRHCEACLCEGFHNVLFDLAIVGECPIHRRLLTAPCTDCKKAVFSHGLRPQTLEIEGVEKKDCDVIYQSNCKHVVFDPVRYSWDFWSIKKVHEREIIQGSGQVFGWFIELARTSKDCWEMMQSLATLSIKEDQWDDLSNRFSVAEQLAGPFPVRTCLELRPVSWMSSLMCSHVENIDCHDYFKIYRCVRRYIYLTYLRGHHHCWRRIRRLSFDEALALRSSRICSISLAYASWRLGMEGFCNIEGLHSSEPCDHIHRYPGIAKDDYDHCDPNSLAVWMLASFFSVWGEIEKLAETRSFYIQRDRGMGWFNLARWTWTIGDEEDGIRCWVIFPDPAALTKISNKRCSIRRSRKGGMIDNGTLDSLRTWAWANGSGSAPGLIFRVKAFDMQLPGSSYKYLCV